MQPHVFIITVNYNNPDDTIDFLNSIEASVSVSFSCIVIDNSTDAKAQLKVRQVIEQRATPGNQIYCTTEDQVDPTVLHVASFSHITCRNRGFAAANNIALKQIISNNSFAASDYVFILNNDTVIEKNCIKNLLKAAIAKSLNTGMVAPLIYYFHDKKIWSAGGWFNKTTGLLKAYDKGKSNLSITGNKKINFLTGCAWFIQIDLLRKKAGLLDEGYFMYYEDLDYSLHLYEQGFQLVLIPEAIIWHKVGASSNGEVTPFSAYWMMRGRVRTVRKHSKSFSFYSAIFILIISRLFFVFPVAFVKGNIFIIKNQVAGFLDEYFKQSGQPVNTRLE